MTEPVSEPAPTAEIVPSVAAVQEFLTARGRGADITPEAQTTTAEESETLRSQIPEDGPPTHTDLLEDDECPGQYWQHTYPMDPVVTEGIITARQCDGCGYEQTAVTAPNTTTTLPTVATQRDRPRSSTDADVAQHARPWTDERSLMVTTPGCPELRPQLPTLSGADQEGNGRGGHSVTGPRGALRRVAWELGVMRPDELGPVRTVLWCVVLVAGMVLWVVMLAAFWCAAWLDWRERGTGQALITTGAALLFTWTLWPAAVQETRRRRERQQTNRD
ncbi:MAG: hypothetical protein ACRDSP_26775 [Pseudonocardiaceae bacterium]